MAASPERSHKPLMPGLSHKQYPRPSGLLRQAIRAGGTACFKFVTLRVVAVPFPPPLSCEVAGSASPGRLGQILRLRSAPRRMTEKETRRRPGASEEQPCDRTPGGSLRRLSPLRHPARSRSAVPTPVILRSRRICLTRNAWPDPATALRSAQDDGKRKRGAGLERLKNNQVTGRLVARFGD